MILVDLFLGFLKVGLFSFGGAYAAIPLIRDVVLQYGWLDEEMLTYMIAVSESTPGPIMINLATYAGASKAGILGALIATFAVALPAFLIVLIITAIFAKALDNRYVQAVLQGLTPCMIGIIFATGCHIIITNLFGDSWADMDVKAFIFSLVLGAVYWGQKVFLKKKMSPIVLILISALLGAVGYA